MTKLSVVELVECWTTECFQQWGVCCKLGAFSLVQHCIEIWAFDAGIILSGLLSLHMLAAQAIAYQYVIILYSIAWGLGMAGGIRVGQHLGANNPGAAHLASTVTLIAAGACGVTFAPIVISLRNQLPLVFTQESQVVELTASVLPIIGVGELFDFIGGTTNSILRGCGRQAVGTAITLPAFIVVLTVGTTVMLETPLTIKGFWIVALAALCFQSMAGTIFLCRLNWEHEAAMTQIRIKESKEGQAGVLTPAESGIHISNIASHTIVGVESMPTEKEISVYKIHHRKNSTRKRLSKTVILQRAVAFALSAGCLVAGLVFREVAKKSIHEDAQTNSSTVFLESV